MTTSPAHYRDKVRRPPLLQPQQEYELAKSWREYGDRAAAEKLVTSHLRLVVKTARGYRGYGLSDADLIAEGNVGLMQATERFDPDMGYRFATYAIFWIRARMQEHILRSWSLVKMGTTANQKRLFFNLRKAKRRISANETGDLRPDHVKLLAEQLGVADRDVIDMNRRLHGDFSLNVPVGDDDETGDWQERLVDDRAVSQEDRLVESDETGRRHMALSQALAVLNGRERRIFEARRLADDPIKLETLASEFGVSRERVRQIELRAFQKVQQGVKTRVAALESTANSSA
jgi:RNA polymerase sigma-32 factor